ncbi:LegC family aminotransferase [Paenisporosarcina cavernae]|uniref:LegC family aminotransferase n=1 Tax=Paenisporosarcina cavernae TaxID=2320858 RepID=A0A385YTZ8_9BACL|nr:LegC family aminotransferase [Paenisporosarcina cavernae]AYC28953.1 LegC family aminotransferase [Paenisporosarcina cavernae]
MNDKWMQFTQDIKELYKKDFVPLHEPTFNGNEIKYVTECIESGWVSSVGAYVTRFEQDLANFVGAKRAVAVVNGTAALHIALKVVGVKPKDEVLMPSLTFIATANAASYLGAVPHFVDVSMKTLGMDSEKLHLYLEQISEFRNGELYNKQTGCRIAAIVPMHTFGHPADINGILEICDRYNLPLVEDAAESLGSYYNKKHTGSFGKINAFSFNGNKIITTGGGGALVTDDEELADYAKHLTTTAKVPHKWEYEHDSIGYNYRMPNINAALGCAQLEKMNTFIQHKRDLTEFYKIALSDFADSELFTEPENAKSNYWLQTILLDGSKNRDEILRFLNENGVMSRPIWKPMHQLPMFKECPSMDLNVTEQLNRRLINIPSTPVEVK